MSTTMDASKFNAQVDPHFSLEPCQIMQEDMLQMLRDGRYTDFSAKKDLEQEEIKKITEQIANGGDDHAFSEVVLEGGEKVWMAWGDKMATSYCRVAPGSIHTKDGKVEATVQLASISQSTNSGSIVNVNISNLVPKITEVAVGAAISISIMRWFVSLAREGIKDTLEAATFRLANYLMAKQLIGPGTQIWLVEGAAPVLGRFGSAILSNIFGGVLGGLAAWGIIELYKYMFLKDYSLRGFIYNFDPDHEWLIKDFYGYNESITEQASTGPIKRMTPAGKVLIPGMTAAATTGSVAVYYKSFASVNEHSTFGGFTVCGHVQRQTGTGDDTVGVNFAYRVEKMADNSMAIAAGAGESAKHYFQQTLDNGSRTKKQKLIQVDSPITASITSPELYSTPDDFYRVHVNIGVPPKDYVIHGQ